MASTEPKWPIGRDPRLAVEVLEGERLRAALRADALDVEHERPPEPFGRRDLEVLAVERHVVAVRPRG